jgi:hypothetical protein
MLHFFLVLSACLVGGIFFFSCKNEKKIIYTPKDLEFELKKISIDYGERVIEQTEYLRIYTYANTDNYFVEQKKGVLEASTLLTVYSASSRDLISVNTNIFKKGAGNEFSVELQREKAPEFLFEYSSLHLNLKETKMPKNLFSLVPDSLPSEVYSFDFKFTEKFLMNDYPDELKILLTIKTRKGEEVFEQILKKGDFKEKKMFDLKY